LSVEQPNIVDFVGTEKTTGHVVLTISDHLGWEREDEHLMLLQTKLNTYLAFVESGEISVKYPAAKGRRIRIEIVAKYPFSDRALDFLHKAQPVVEAAGYDLAWKMLDRPEKPEKASGPFGQS
jgi:hypothetical protein